MIVTWFKIEIVKASAQLLVRGQIETMHAGSGDFYTSTWHPMDSIISAFDSILIIPFRAHVWKKESHQNKKN